MNKILIVLLLLFSNIFCNGFEKIYEGAVALYENKEYESALESFLILEKNDFENNFIYFLMGRSYRTLGKSDEAIKYLKKYISNYGKLQNKVYAQINLAYEYLNRNNEGDLNKAIKISDEIATGGMKNNRDVKYCYAVVYNRYGFSLLQEDSGRSGNAEYYLDVVSIFEKALKKRPELVGIANNLCVAYIRLLEIYKKEDKEYSEIIEKCKSVLLDKKYKKFTRGKFQETKDYFFKVYS